MVIYAVMRVVSDIAKSWYFILKSDGRVNWYRCHGIRCGCTMQLSPLRCDFRFSGFSVLGTFVNK